VKPSGSILSHDGLADAVLETASPARNGFEDAHPANEWVEALGQSGALKSSCLQRLVAAVRLDLQRANGHLEGVEEMAGGRNTSVGRAVRLASLKASGCNITGCTEEHLFGRANATAGVQRASVLASVHGWLLLTTE
jgi:hypothetical protein